MTQELKCKDKVRGELKDRIKDLSKLWALYQQGDEEGDEELGTFNEYGLCFDYVAPHTFNDQERGFFCYQLSTGGPGDEFRFYTDENLNPVRIEYWFLDWFDGAKVTLRPGTKEEQLMTEIWDFFKEIGSVEAELEKSREEY